MNLLITDHELDLEQEKRANQHRDPVLASTRVLVADALVDRAL